MYSAVTAIIAVSPTTRDSPLWQPWTSQTDVKNYRYGSTNREWLTVDHSAESLDKRSSHARITVATSVNWF